MSEKKFTQGECKISNSGIAIFDAVANLWFCLICDEKGNVLQRIYGKSKEQAESNAKLYHTAPELLEACERALQVLEQENIFGQARLLLAVAIKKALS